MDFLGADRLLPVSRASLGVARSLYQSVAELPIISPHGHTDPEWFAKDTAFPDPATLFVIPDHYITRMLISQGVTPQELGLAPRGAADPGPDPRSIWRSLAQHYHLFRATPSRMWLEYAFHNLFGLEERLTPDNADHQFDHITECLKSPQFRPRALFDRFRLEVLSTTDSALDRLQAHRQIADSAWPGRVIPTYRPDIVTDPETPGFADNVERFCALAGEPVGSWEGYLNAHRIRRAVFSGVGATATDHGHPTARTENLPASEAAALFEKALSGTCTASEAEAFRGQMLTEMARMSIEDGLVMQLHPGSRRNHSPAMFHQFGPNVGFDIPGRVDFVGGLKPLLDAVGLDSRLTLILFTLDESTYARELAPLAGAYPAVRLGPAWWFHDSPEGMRRYREMTTETAGFYNTVGFNDDTRGFCSIPARHDMSRRVDCAYLADLVVSGRLDEAEAAELAYELAYGLAKRAYRL